jgi:hypothetical protein
VNVTPDAATDPAFEAEAKRQGRRLRRRQRLYVLPAFGIVLLATAILLGSAFLVGVKHSNWLMGIWLGDAIAFVIGLQMWFNFASRRLRPMLAIACPSCGGTAHLKPVPLPDTHIYLDCPQCHRRADTAFAVPKTPRFGRISLYDWQAEENTETQTSVTVRVRMPFGKGDKKGGKKGNSA